jgi:hypothetical protein
MDQCGGALDLQNESVRDVLEGKEAHGYDAKKAERFFKNNPDALDYAKNLIKHLSPDMAQKRFMIYCRGSKPMRCLTRDLFLEEIKNKAGNKEIAYA